jgi:TfuA protein
MPSCDTTIFVGPSLYGCRLKAQRNEKWLGPAKRGDVYKEAFRAHQIVLIDGRFNQVFSVSPQEILEALDGGVRVIGAASMGALRAAECWRYGMIGVGKIFEAYKSGEVEDDAWVAMTYDEETYRPLTEPPCSMAQKRADALAAIELSRN